MIELRLRKTLLRLDFSFFAVVALYLFLDGSGLGLSALAACGLHELSHLAVMTVFGVPVDEITFYGAGIRITSPKTDEKGGIARVLILLAGCAANFAAALLFWRFGNLAAAAINMCTAIFNLLPLGELDGAMLLKTLLIKKCKPENVDKYMKAAAMLSGIAVAAVVFLLGGGNFSFTLATTLLYIIIVGCSKI